MAFTTELLSILDDNDEPLKKRLCIAKNAFSSTELPGLNKEGILLQWFCKMCSETKNSDIWETLDTCLTSEHMRDMRQNDIRQDILTSLVKAITKSLKDGENNKVANCALSVLRNITFQRYLKHDIRRYCTLISALFNSAFLNTDTIIQILILCQKTLKTDHSKHFLSHLFPALVNITVKYPENTKLNQECVKLLQKVIFPQNSKEHEFYLKKVFDEQNFSADEGIPAQFIKKLKQFYETESYSEEQVIETYKFAFTAFISVHKTQQSEVHKYLLLLLRSIGFEIEKKFSINDEFYDVQKSRLILATLLSVLSKANLSLDTTVNKVTFSDTLNLLVKSVITSGRISRATFKILSSVILVNPLIIDTTISDVINCIVVHKHEEDLQIEYEKVMIAILEMYLKLHRVHKFTSELLRTLKSTLTGSEIKDVASVKEMFTPKIVNYFQNCVSLQSSKQVISMMRTLLMHLEELITTVLPNIGTTGSTHFVYIEAVCQIFCHFLRSVRVAEHTNSTLTHEKFHTHMNELRETLNKFGTQLLNMEHVHTMMYSYLSVYETWTELWMILQLYAPLEGADTLPDDIHAYLTPPQWSLITQRIKNFGELPCKHIMLGLQCLRTRAAMFLGEAQNDLETNTIKFLTSNLEVSWRVLLSDPFVLHTLMPNMKNAHIITVAEYLVQDILDKNNFEMLKEKNLFECRVLTLSILYACLSKIDNLFRRKRKHDDKNLQSFSTNVFKSVDLDAFIREKELNLTQISDLYNESQSIAKSQIDEKNVSEILDIIRLLPVCYLSKEIQSFVFLYLLSACVDLGPNQSASELFQQFSMGIIENSWAPNMSKVISPNILVDIVISYLSKYKEVLSFIIQKILTDDVTIPSFKSAVNNLVKHLTEEKYLDTAIITLKVIHKTKQYKLAEESKKTLKRYKIKLCKNLVEHVLNDEEITNSKIEAYVLTLQKYLVKDSNDNLSKLCSKIGSYIEYVVNNMSKENASGCLSLMKTILIYKTKISDLPEDFILRCWTVCKRLTPDEEYSASLNKTICLLFKHVSVEQFPAILKDLLEATVAGFANGEILTQLKIWNFVMTSSLSNIKQLKLQKTLQRLLEHIVVYLMNNKNEDLTDAVVRLQVTVIGNKQVSQPSSILDIYLQTVHLIISQKHTENSFPKAFSNCMDILETLIKVRLSLLIDRLPPLLLHLRLIISELCHFSDAEKNHSREQIVNLSDCAFRCEKVVQKICNLKKDMRRIASYLIADILKQYEVVTLLPEVKTHLNKCLYCLLALCDNHAISFLLRALSPASTELFKRVNDNYNKFHKFTGKI